jgi:hypothetical protein
MTCEVTGQLLDWSAHSHDEYQSSGLIDAAGQLLVSGTMLINKQGLEKGHGDKVGALLNHGWLVVGLPLPRCLPVANPAGKRAAAGKSDAEARTFAAIQWFVPTLGLKSRSHRP